MITDSIFEFGNKRWKKKCQYINYCYPRSPYKECNASSSKANAQVDRGRDAFLTRSLTASKQAWKSATDISQSPT